MRHVFLALFLLGGSLAVQAQTCGGTERWAVKEASDKNAQRIDLTNVTAMSVAQLLSVPEAHRPTDNYTRVVPDETHVYSVKAFLVKWKHEQDDDDYHLVLTDQTGSYSDEKNGVPVTGHSFIAEIPDPKCISGATGKFPAKSRFVDRFKAGREAIDTRYPDGGQDGSWNDAAGIPVEVVGVGFFDRPHEQTGRAPNNIELHPILQITFGVSNNNFSSLSAFPIRAVNPAAKSVNWSFAVSGDSRNCGDIAMSAIAQGAISDHAAFYWHLGDFRAIYDFDQDYKQAAGSGVTIDKYEREAWDDFIQNQLSYFGSMPVFLAMGNHETIAPKTRDRFIQQFGDWLATPLLRAQRLQDDANDHLVKTYYHWIQGGVDFITMDNATADQFDDNQLGWFEKVLSNAASNAAVRSVVVGMHEALPDSLSAGHSMNDSAQGTVSGRRAYHDLVEFEKTGKHVYVLASHSHFYLEDVYNTACRKDQRMEVLPGWIVGTAGATWLRPPKNPGSGKVLHDVYGYLVGTVFPDGQIQFSFRPVSTADVPAQVKTKYGDLVDRCFSGNASNKSTYSPEGPASPPNCP